MKTLNIFLFLSIAISSFTSAAQVPTFSLQDRIKTQEFFKKSHPILFGKPELRSVKAFQEALKIEKGFLKKSHWLRAIALIEKLEDRVPESILLPIVYWRIIEPSSANLETTLSYLMLSKLLMLRDNIDAPNSSSKAEALAALVEASGDNRIQTANIFSRTMTSGLIPQMAARLAKLKKDDDFTDQVINNRIVGYPFEDIAPHITPYSLSHLGYIPGNEVELVSENDQSPERVQWYNDRIMFNGAQLDWSKPYMKMPTREEIARYDQIPSDLRPHIAFAKDPIFMKIRDMIDCAEDSIFIDIFLFGGTLGGTLAKYLIDETVKKRAKNPKFQTIILHDFATNYNMKDEMMPVFRYIRDRINGKSAVPGEAVVPAGSLILLQANIQRHTPGIPFGLSELIEKNVDNFKEIEKRNTYYESKIDHSKVIVIDGNTGRAEAYFGSKNWTDHSGGYYYDNALWIKGPAATLVQYSYYDDIDAALTTDEAEQKWFFFKEEGFGNEKYIAQRDSILASIQITLDNIKTAGEDTVQLTEANVDGRIKNTRNMIIDMIIKAKSHIYMEQLFIYDKYINDAFIKAKIQNPTLDVRILADHNGNFGMNGLPNTIFMEELNKYGIQIRARQTQTIPVTYPDGSTGKYHQENHRKIISVDGKTLLVGSSNMNPDTFQGSFREFGAQMFNQQQISKFERDFLGDWQDSSKTEPFDVAGRKLVVFGKELSEETSSLINSILGQILRVKDQLEFR